MSTYTFTGTGTYTVTDVKAVMQNTYEDIIGFANRGFISYSSAEKWINDLTYILNEKVLKFFEIKLYDKDGNWYKTYRYTMDIYGYLSSGSSSGGINYYSLTDNSKAKMYAELDFTKPNASTVDKELDNRGWGFGTSSQGNEVYERSYVSNDLQLKRTVITK